MDEKEFLAASEKQFLTRNDVEKMNESGIIPVEYKVLIEPEQVNEQTSGGLYIPQQTKEKDEMAQVKGVVVAIGANAFEDWQDPRPEVGNMVYFAKYAGYIVEGADERKYRLINDKDIAAIIEEKEPLKRSDCRYPITE